jgi:hypothetical protein
MFDAAGQQLEPMACTAPQTTSLGRRDLERIGATDRRGLHRMVLTGHGAVVSEPVVTPVVSSISRKASHLCLHQDAKTGPGRIA